MQLEAKEPTHGGMPARSQSFEGAIAADALVGADRQFGAVSNIDASFLTRQGMDQHGKRGQ